jgi:hypothetical protein
MLSQDRLLQLQKYNFDLLARQEPSGWRRLRYIALAHLKDGKSPTETALALRVTPRAATRWLKWFADDGVGRLTGIPHYWSSQRLPKAQEDAFRQAVEQLQHSRGDGRQYCGSTGVVARSMRIHGALPLTLLRSGAVWGAR